jgi:hypothetical protein
MLQEHSTAQHGAAQQGDLNADTYCCGCCTKYGNCSERALSHTLAGGCNWVVALTGRPPFPLLCFVCWHQCSSHAGRHASTSLLDDYECCLLCRHSGQVCCWNHGHKGYRGSQLDHLGPHLTVADNNGTGTRVDHWRNYLALCCAVCVLPPCNTFLLLLLLCCGPRARLTAWDECTGTA